MGYIEKIVKTVVQELTPTELASMMTEEQTKAIKGEATLSNRLLGDILSDLIKDESPYTIYNILEWAMAESNPEDVVQAIINQEPHSTTSILYPIFNSVELDDIVEALKEHYDNEDIAEACGMELSDLSGLDVEDVVSEFPCDELLNQISHSDPKVLTNHICEEWSELQNDRGIQDLIEQEVSTKICEMNVRELLQDRDFTTMDIKTGISILLDNLY